SRPGPSTRRTWAIAYGASPANDRGATRITVKLSIVPSPESGTGAHARLPQAGQNSFGGIAISPHAVQRMPVSWPSRARSKKFLRVITGSFTAFTRGRGG